jgi:hypothetical protein
MDLILGKKSAETFGAFFMMRVFSKTGPAVDANRAYEPHFLVSPFCAEVPRVLGVSPYDPIIVQY